MPRLLMIVPSRGRPAHLDRLVATWCSTTSGDADLVVALDDDDPQLYRYNAHRVAMVSVGPRQSFIAWTNEIAVGHADRYDFVGSMGDDHLPRTPGWDKLVCEALDELGTGVAYGDDLAGTPALPSAAAVTSNIVASLGYLLPPVLEHHGSELYFRSLGEDLGRSRFLREVVLEHVHYSSGKSSIDHTYLECAATIDADRARYEMYMEREWPTALARLRAELHIAPLHQDARDQPIHPAGQRHGD
ncbi:MAG: hypothetical protein ACYCTE_08645 [Acidimicrobiales bacterium]